MLFDDRATDHPADGANSSSNLNAERLSIPVVTVIRTRIRIITVFFDESERVVVRTVCWLGTLLAAAGLTALTIYGFYELIKTLLGK